jgi:hypothetical protein
VLQIKCEVQHEWWVGKNLEGSNHYLFEDNDSAFACGDFQNSRIVSVPQPQQLLTNSIVLAPLQKPKSSKLCSSHSWTRDEVEVTLLAPFGAGDQMLHLFESQLLSLFLCRAPSLMRGRVCNLQCSDASSISSYIAIDGMSASSSWCRVPNGAHNQILISLFDSYYVFSV